MKELVIFLAKQLVDRPEEVQVNELEEDGKIILELSVHPDEMGKIIGKNGRIAHSIRSLTKASATKNGQRVIVDII